MPRSKKHTINDLLAPLAPLTKYMPVVVYNLQGAIVYVNEWLEEFSGFSGKRLKGKRIGWLLLPGSSISAKNFRTFLKVGSEYAVDGIIRAKHGKQNTFLNSHIESGKGRLVLVFGHELGTRHRLAFLRPIFNTQARVMGELSSDAMVSVDSTGRVISFNEVFQWMAGVPPQQLFGKPLVSFLRKGAIDFSGLHEAEDNKTLVAAMESNTNPWEVLFDNDLSDASLQAHWLLDRNISFTRTDQGVTINSGAPDTFLVFKRLIDHFNYDVRWHMTVSFGNMLAASFFFSGTADYDDANACTPDVDGYLLGFEWTPGEHGYGSGRCAVQLKRWCRRLIRRSLQGIRVGRTVELIGERAGGLFRLYVNGVKALEYMDENFLRFSLSYRTGLIFGGFPVHIRSLRLEQRASAGCYASFVPRNVDVVFAKRPDQVFEAEVFWRQSWQSKTIDIYLRRVTELRKAQSEIKTMLVQKERTLGLINQELVVAASVLTRLLPQKFPEIEGVTFESFYQPSGQVGGDLYDVFKARNGNIAILLYDVSGHGVPAALVSVMFKTLFQKYFNEELPLLEQLALVNTELYGIVGDVEIDNPMFVTIFYGMFDPRTRSLSYVGAGTPSPLVLQEEGLTLLRTKGLPLGMDATLNSDEHTIQLSRGTKVIMFTDGLFEIFNAAGVLYGGPRMADFICAHKHLPLKELFAVIIREQKEYTNNADLRDDVSMLGMEL